jgi:hypothetical protein
MAGRYLFVAGAPGSRWSGVCKTLYSSPDLDRTDANPRRQYSHSAAGEEPMHLGAYWDPGMEYGEWFDRLSEHEPAVCERVFDAPFSGQGTRLIKSHTFCHHLEYLHRHWPDCGIVLVHRPDQVCLDWWIKAGGFDIDYPDYRPYYRDLDTMARRIAAQNRDLLAYAHASGLSFDMPDSHQLCRRLGLVPAPATTRFQELDAAVAAVPPG